mmetsp:Transcript_92467/g.247337  ORF Transcript_92467/g.247337 Transcript_92467/m.247337 type:complete len:574 (+) Transcript_92467:33-1754(+)
MEIPRPSGARVAAAYETVLKQSAALSGSGNRRRHDRAPAVYEQVLGSAGRTVIAGGTEALSAVQAGGREVVSNLSYWGRKVVPDQLHKPIQRSVSVAGNVVGVVGKLAPFPGARGAVQLSRRSQVNHALPLYAPEYELRGYWICTVAVVSNRARKITEYQWSRLMEYGGLLTTVSMGTVWTGTSITMYELLWLSVVGCSVALGNLQSDVGPDVNLSNLRALVDYLNGSIPFFIALFCTTSLQRWWAMRTDAFQSISNATSNIMIILIACLPEEEFSVAMEKVFRLAAASVLTMTRAVRSEDRYLKWEDLVKRHFLSRVEGELLSKTPCLHVSGVLWCWIQRLCVEMMRRHAESSEGFSGVPERELQHQCTRAREGFELLHTYLDTQLPFAYAHLIVFAVNIVNLVVASSCGIQFAFAVKRQDYQAALAQAVFGVVLHSIYQGLLVVAHFVENPFCDEEYAFPIIAFQDYVMTSCEALLAHGRKFPGRASVLAIGKLRGAAGVVEKAESILVSGIVAARFDELAAASGDIVRAGVQLTTSQRSVLKQLDHAVHGVCGNTHDVRRTRSTAPALVR